MRLLVHLHLHYYDQTDYFIGKLSSITGCSWDLYITEVCHDPVIEKKFSTLGANVIYIETEDRGYDIWPFIKVMKSVDLGEYDLVMKLHTKGWRNRRDRMNGLKMQGFGWRDELVDSMLKDKSRFTSILKHFSSHPGTGLVCSNWCYKRTLKVHPEDLDMLDDELVRIGLGPVRSRKFCAGTMFIARASIYRFLQSGCISMEMFGTESISGSAGTMSHVYERILSMAPAIMSYKVKTVSTSAFRTVYIMCSGAIQPLLDWLFSIDREGKEKTKYLTVLGMRFRLGTKKGNRQLPSAHAE